VPQLTLDGVRHDVPDGLTVLEAAAVAGVDIPTLCSDPRLEPSGACRLCIVAVDGQARPVAACTTRAVEGMSVQTRSRQVESARRTLLELLAHDYPADAVASSPGEPFHRMLADYGVEATPDPHPAAVVDDSHPLIHVDLAQCISCWRCVRICEEVQGQFVWRITGRGDAARIEPDSGGLFADSSCVSCGACVDTCPTGALEDKELLGAAAPTAWTRTTCPYCGVGCEMQVGTRDGRIVNVVPAADAPVNRGHLCVKGRYAHGFVTAPDRQTRPMVREGDTWRTVSWDEAIAAAAAALGRAVDVGGPGAVGVLGSARATNEDNYLVQKLARCVLGTNNVDCCARVCHAPSAAGLSAVFGTGAATSSFADIEAARTILVCGSNTTENHPIVGARIKQAKLRGAGLIVIDPRRVELADYADLHLRPRPGTTVALLNAMAATIVQEGLVDRAYLASRVDGFDEYRSVLLERSPEQASEVCGVPATDIRAAARMYATATPSICFHGLGVTEHTQGTEGVMCLANLALLTGNVGRPGAGVNPLRGQNNVQGAAHMGCEPAHLPGYAPLADARDRVGEIWQAEVPEERGLDAMQMIDAAGEGTVRALYIVGWDILLTQPDMNTTRRALDNLDALIVQDLFLNETARDHATVFLPAASAFEKDGTFMNSERRVQRVRAAVAPPGDAKPDWQITCLLAAALGRGDLFDYGEPSDIWEEIRRVWQPGAGMTYSRLDLPGGLQWPCPDEAHPGTTTLHDRAFGGVIGVRAGLQPVSHQPSPEQPTDEFPLVLVTGRSLYQFNAGTMTTRSATQRLRETDRLEICAEDAAAVGAHDGDLVHIQGRYGEASLPIEITNRVAAGVVFATFNDPATLVNRLTGPHRDTHTNTPEYKLTAVRVERDGLPADAPIADSTAISRSSRGGPPRSGTAP
jgi:formate dehydrogenase major subunit